MLRENHVQESLNLIKIICTCYVATWSIMITVFFLFIFFSPSAADNLNSDLEPDLDDAVSGAGDEVPVLGPAQRQARYPVVVS